MMKNKVLVAIRVFVALAVWFLIGRGYSVFVDPMLDGRLPELVRKILSGMVVPYTVGLGVSFLILLGMEVEKFRWRNSQVVSRNTWGTYVKGISGSNRD